MINSFDYQKSVGGFIIISFHFINLTLLSVFGGFFFNLFKAQSLPFWILLVSSLISFKFHIKTTQTTKNNITHLKICEVKTQNFCLVCQNEKPLRTKHCYKCGVCCSRYDHHCDLLGVCIGSKNHKNFWFLLLFECISIFLSIYISLQVWLDGGYIFGIIIAFLNLLWLVIPFSLFFFHTWMITSNQTTWEFLKHDKIIYLKDLDEEILPFDLGFRKNIFEFFFKMHDPNYMWEIPYEIYEKDYVPKSNFCNNKHYSCF